LNRGHVLAPVVLAAQRAREEFLERMRRRCEEFPDSVVSVALYGSVARREAGPESDVDVLFVVEGDAADDDPEIAARIQSLETDVLAWSGNRMQPLVESDAHLERLVLSNEPIVAHWSNEALTLHGRDLSALIREFARQGEAK
jgi:predicted nucleotidyltransferase